MHHKVVGKLLTHIYFPEAKEAQKEQLKQIHTVDTFCHIVTFVPEKCLE